MSLRSNPILTRGTKAIDTAKVMTKRMPATRSQTGMRQTLGEIGNTRAAARLVGALEKKVSPKKRATKVAARRLAKVESPNVSVMEVDCDEVEAVPCLPEGVADIDLLDADNPQLCAEYVPTMYNYLRELEDQMKVKPDFLKGCPINGKMRGVLLDWLVEVHLQFKLLQETLYMTVAIIDRFLQIEGLTIKRNKLQLVGVSAMFIASKVEEMYAPEINDFVYITDNAYSALEIRETELRILRAINFGLGRPLPLHFLRRNSKAGDVDVLQHTVAKYVLESSIVEYDFAQISPSMLAAASLFLSIRLLESNSKLSDCWTPTLQHYSTYSSQQLLPVVCKLAGVMKKASGSKLQAIYTKYQSKKFLRVADMEEFKGEVLKKLAAKDLEGL